LHAEAPQAIPSKERFIKWKYSQDTRVCPETTHLRRAEDGGQYGLKVKAAEQERRNVKSCRESGLPVPSTGRRKR
ncbi:unnamed protein product, partial [Gulo gulo]